MSANIELTPQYCQEWALNMSLQIWSPSFLCWMMFSGTAAVFMCVYWICAGLRFPSLGTLSGFHHSLSIGRATNIIWLVVSSAISFPACDGHPNWVYMFQGGGSTSHGRDAPVWLCRQKKGFKTPRSQITRPQLTCLQNGRNIPNFPAKPILNCRCLLYPGNSQAISTISP